MCDAMLVLLWCVSNFGGSPRWDTYFGTMAKPNFAWESKMSKTAVSVQPKPEPVKDQ